MFTVKVSGLKGAINDVIKINSNLKIAQKYFLQESASRTKVLAKQNINPIYPKSTHSLDLKGSIKKRYHKNYSTVYTDIKYAMAVEKGTKPHDIPNAFGLGFTVKHPGAFGYPSQFFMENAFYRYKYHELPKILRDIESGVFKK